MATSRMSINQQVRFLPRVVRFTLEAVLHICDSPQADLFAAAAAAAPTPVPEARRLVATATSGLPKAMYYFSDPWTQYTFKVPEDTTAIGVGLWGAGGATMQARSLAVTRPLARRYTFIYITVASLWRRWRLRYGDSPCFPRGNAPSPCRPKRRHSFFQRPWKYLPRRLGRWPLGHPAACSRPVGRRCIRGRRRRRLLRLLQSHCEYAPSTRDIDRPMSLLFPHSAMAALPPGTEEVGVGLIL